MATARAVCVASGDIEFRDAGTKVESNPSILETHHVRYRTISPRNPRLAASELPAGNAQTHDLRGRYVLGRPQHQILVRAATRLVRTHARQGLDRAGLAEGIWRWRTGCRRGQGFARGDGGDRRPFAAVELWHLDARAGIAEIRHRGAEERASAEDRRRPDPLVSGLFRAECRIGPRLAADPRRKRRRRVRHQRPKNLDVVRELRRLDFLLGTYRRIREEA